jgi:hypothetical protein
MSGIETHNFSSSRHDHSVQTVYGRADCTVKRDIHNGRHSMKLIELYVTCELVNSS